MKQSQLNAGGYGFHQEAQFGLAGYEIICAWIVKSCGWYQNN